MRVRFWGTRGSIAAPGPNTIRYGGNTSCVEVRTDDGTLLIFDCGTGARDLGLSLIKSGPVRAHLFIGHTHSDHIQGLSFFVPAFIEGSHLTIYGPPGINLSFPRAIGGQMDYAYFPVPIDALPSQLDFRELGEGEFQIGEVQVRTQSLNHTAPCLGYRVQVGGATLVYATDHEPHTTTLWRPDRAEAAYEAEAMLHRGDAQHADFLRGADLVIHDAQYTAAEYATKIGWGHSPVEYVVDVALAARAGTLALYHHEPTRNDDAMDKLVDMCRERVARTGMSLNVIAAAEGEEIILPEHDILQRGDLDPRAPNRPTRARVLVAEDDADVSHLLQTSLRQDGYEVSIAATGLQAVKLALGQPFDLILLDAKMPEMDGFAACRAIRADARLDSVPIVMLTARSDEAAVLEGFSEGVTDFMTKPFAMAQFRARVHLWLTRRANPAETPATPPA